MNEKKEYLNEEWYQKVKKKITKTSLIIFILSILIGGGLIAAGIISNEQKSNAALKESEEKAAAANTRLSEIATEKETLTKQYDAKNQECDSLNMSDSDWYTKVNQCHRDASAISSKINDLEMEEFELNNGNYTVFYTKSFLPFIGIGVILIGGMIALMFYVIAKRREITAFTTQQVMPVAQEGIEKMAPTIGSAVGTITKESLEKAAPAIGNATGIIAKEVSKGVKEGLKDEK